jgi:hypothetical protein
MYNNNTILRIKSNNLRNAKDEINGEKDNNVVVPYVDCVFIIAGCSKITILVKNCFWEEIYYALDFTLA